MIRVGKALVPQVVFILSVLAVGRSPAAGLLNVAYTPMVVAIGLWLVLARPLGYIGFVFWIWMLTPLVRRLADFASGYHPVSFIMIAPLAVTVLSALPVLKHRRALPQPVMLTVITIVSVLIYGFFLGATSVGLPAAVFALVNWSAPALFALYLLWSPGGAAEKSSSVFDALLWGGMGVGIYGLYQFLYLPPWDEYWMRSSELLSIGNPQPLMVRVFSTLNAPAVLAVFLESSLLIAVAAAGLRSKVQALPGAISFLLSLVRSSWGGFALGLAVLIWRTDRKRRLWYISGLATACVALIPVFAYSAIGDTVTSRAEGVSSISSDESLSVRLNLYRGFGTSSISTVFGLGLGGTGDVSSRLGGANQDADTARIDSGLLEIISDFGVFSIFMFLGVGSLLARALIAGRYHPSALTSAVVALASASQVLLGNPFFGPAAMCFYPFVALAILFGIESEASVPRLSSRGRGRSVRRPGGQGAVSRERR